MSNGSRTAPWRTVGKAAQTVKAGQSVTVLAASYPERVVIEASGTAGAPITFIGQGFPAIKGIEMLGDYVVVRGFELANAGNPNEANARHGYGAYIGGSNDILAGNHIHDLCFEGVLVDGDNNIVAGNTISRAQMAGAQINGNNNQILENDVSATRQYPRGCLVRRGADADGLRYFGSGHRFAGNFIHDIDSGTDVNPSPHVDCFQTWGPASNVTFERNRCVWPQPTPDTPRQFCENESLKGPTTDITLRNNIFVNGRDGCMFEVNTGPVRFYNNTFVHVLHEAVVVKSANNEIKNNIFYDVGGSGDAFMCDGGKPQRVAANIHRLPTGQTPGTYCSTYSGLNVDPGFADPAGGAGADFHLRAGSGAIDQGVDLSTQGVTVDFDGVARPQGAAFDIGAFQYTHAQPAARRNASTPTPGAHRQ